MKESARQSVFYGNADDSPVCLVSFLVLISFLCCFSFFAHCYYLLTFPLPLIIVFFVLFSPLSSLFLVRLTAVCFSSFPSSSVCFLGVTI